MSRPHSMSLAPMHIVFDIRKEIDIFIVVKEVKKIAINLGFSSFEAALLSMAVSELATNVVRYAKIGDVTITQSPNLKGLEIQVNDCGSGIKNITSALVDGYSSINSLGLGLGAAKRAVDEMQINSSTSGTTITLKKFLPVSRDDIDTGMVSFPCVGEQANGDAYYVKGYQGDKMLIAVFDGAGNGIKAQQSTQILVGFFKNNYQLPLDVLIHESHQLLLKNKQSRAVEVALMRITPKIIESVIMGNLCIHPNSKPYTSIPAQNGSIGLLIPDNIHVHSFERPKQFRYVIHSDGIRDVNYAALSSMSQSPQKNAEQIFDSYALANDDASVVVVQG